MPSRPNPPTAVVPQTVQSSAVPRRTALTLGLRLALAAVPGLATLRAHAASKRKPPTRILKVLPHFLDLEGRHTVNPSLFDRDAYQFELRQNPALRSGMRFDVLWKTPPRQPGAFNLKLELRGSKAPEQTPVVITTRAFSRGGFSQWTRVPVVGADYAALGELLGWRVTLWRDEELLAEQRSFLW